MVLKLKSRTVLRPLIFNHPLTSLACHGVRMFVRLCYLVPPIFRQFFAIMNSAIFNPVLTEVACFHRPGNSAHHSWNRSIRYLKLKLIKTYLCSTMLQDRLRNLRLSILELDRLHLRRIKADDLLLCYKMINNLVDVDVATCLHSLTAGLPEATVLSSKSLTVVLHVMLIFFSNRVINIWNSLPSHILQAPIVATFRKRLCDFNFSKFSCF